MFDFKNKFSFYFRNKRSKFFKEYILNKKNLNILDLGGTEEFLNSIGYDYLKKRNIQITLVNLNTKIKNRKIFKVKNIDLFKFKSKKKFDLVFSNSTIEHVGSIENMIEFSNICRKFSNKYFIQTPNYFFLWNHILFFLFFNLSQDFYNYF